MLKQSPIVTLCLLLLLFASCRNETRITIRGEIANLESPYIIITHTAANAFVIDTLLANNRGRFVYRTNIDTATVFTLYINNFANSVVFFADKGERISVRGDAQLMDLIQLSGNETNNELTAFRNKNRELLRERSQETLRLSEINQELSLRAEEFIAEHPTRLSSVILINEFFTNIENPEALENVLTYLEGEVLRTRLARQLEHLSEQLNESAEGALVPYFELITTENDTINSHNLLEKYLLLSFISTEGTASRQMVESLRESYNILSNDTIQFVSIYIDSGTLPVTYLETDSITWSVVVERGGWDAEVANLLAIQYVPFNILISPDRTISERNILAQRVIEVVSPEKVDAGIVINNIRWATRNVNAPGTFAENPEDFGMLFQWNRRRGWETDGAATRWNSASATGTEWTATNDPCPVGWRMPTDAELESLENAGSIWIMQNDVYGRLFGTAPYQLFLPAAGLRNASNGTRDNANSSGHYWSSTAGGAARAMGLGFCSGTSGVNHRSRPEGLSVRCVAIN